MNAAVIKLYTTPPYLTTPSTTVIIAGVNISSGTTVANF